MPTFGQDVKFGFRVLRANPGFSAVAVLTLALGIAANTTVFSWIDGALLNPMPGAPDGNRLVVLETLSANGDPLRTSYPDYRDYRDTLKQVSGLAAFSFDAFTHGSGVNAERVWGELVTGNYFSVLQVKPIQGRVFSPQEYADSPGAFPVAVISHRFWKTRFGGSPSVIGKTIRLNRRELTIVGVAPAEFRGSMPGLRFDVWAPFMMGAELSHFSGIGIYQNRRARSVFVVGRLRDGAAVEQARAEVAATGQRLAATYPNDNQRLRSTLLPVWKAHTGGQSLLLEPLKVLMAVCLVVLLIVCANIASLLLARSVSRQKEFGVRLAMGAGPWRIARQLLTETAVLTALGALLAVPLTLWMQDAMSGLLPPTETPVAIGSSLNGTVLLFTMLLCGLAALLSGTIPAFWAGRLNLNDTLKEGARGTTVAGSNRIRGALVMGEIALAAVALVGAGLALRSFRNARSIHPGFDSSNVLLARFYLPGYSSEQGRQFATRLRERLESAPGVQQVAQAERVPLGFGDGPWQEIGVDGHVPSPSEDVQIRLNVIAPGFLNLLRIPVLEGRDFNAHDTAESEPVIIVNQTFAKRFFGDRNPVGRMVRVGRRTAKVVGIARDSKYFSPIEAPRPYFYEPFEQRYSVGANLVFYLRGADRPENLVATVRAAAAAIDPNAVFDAMPFEEYTTASLFGQKMAASLLVVLGAVALVLAAVGLYSVMAYAVTQRTQELGVRMALGARPMDLLGMVVRQGLVLALGGLSLGMLGAFGAMRGLSSLLVGVSAADPLTFAAVAGFLTLVALLASYLPARRAATVDPMVALRHQ